MLMTLKMSAVAVCCSSASASRSRASASRFSSSRILDSSSFRDLRASGSLASTFAFAGLARRRIGLSLPLTGATTVQDRGQTSERPAPCQAPASTQNFGYRRRSRNSEVTVTQTTEEVSVTRASLREYAAVQRERYQNASRLEKHRLLDEMVAVTGLHRKAAIRLLRRVPRARAQPGPGGRPRRYGAEVAAAAAVLWQASGRIGAHRLQPFVAELLDRLTQCGDLTLAPPIDKLLRQVSRPRSRGSWRRPGRSSRIGGPPPRGPALGSSTKSPSAPSPTGTTPARASARSISSLTAGAVPRAFTSVRSARSTSPRRGSSSKPSGARASSEWARPCIGCASVGPCP